MTQSVGSPEARRGCGKAKSFSMYVKRSTVVDVIVPVDGDISRVGSGCVGVAKARAPPWRAGPWVGAG